MSIMCRQSIALWCILLFVVSFSEPRGNSSTTDKNERNNFTVKYEIYSNVNSSNNTEAVRYNTRENFTKSNDDAQDEFHANSTNDVYVNSSMAYEFQPHLTKDHEDGNQMPTELTELRVNFMKSDNKSDFTSQEPYENLTQVEDRSNSMLYELLYQDDNKRNIVPYEMCENNTCILLCCPIGNRLVEEECVAEKNNYPFPDVYEYVSNDPLERRLTGKKVDQVFQLAIHDPCRFGRYFFEPDIYPTDEFTLLINGSLYRPCWDQFVETYCLAVTHQDKYEISVCFLSPEDIEPTTENIIPWGLIVSLPFLLITFVVYTILPDLQNMHGYTLRVYIASLFVGYTFLASIQITYHDTKSNAICTALALITHFSFLASFFWLNVMCFDIYWTFGGFRSLQGSAKQRERKKFMIYSIYAWGSASILTIISAIMHFVPSVPREFIRPEFAVARCWFKSDEARAVYFYTPMGITVICNIFLFISTAIKIMHQKKDTAKKLKTSESKRHDDNKQWFNLYLKLFIVMGISWSMEIISWLFKSVPSYVWYFTDLANTLQGPIIFIIFVWKGKIKRLLLKRFGLENRVCSPETRHAAARRSQIPH